MIISMSYIVYSKENKREKEAILYIKMFLILNYDFTFFALNFQFNEGIATS